MKNYKMIGCLFGLMFLLIFSSEVRAQNGCDDCFAYSDESYFCVKTKMEYGEERAYVYERATCQPFRFTGVNVRPLARLDPGELDIVLREAVDIGATVIRFFAPNDGMTNDLAVIEILKVLNTARNHENEEVRNLKFIIVLVNFYGGASYGPDDANKPTYHPQTTTGNTDDLYIPEGSYTRLKKEWFDDDLDISYKKGPYHTWVNDLTEALSPNSYQQQILSFELGNELQRKNDDGESLSTVRFQLRLFVRTTTAIIKENAPKTLVSIGSISTYHALNIVDPTQTDDADVSPYYRDRVYRQPNDSNDDMKSKADFMTIHNYNNEWVSSGLDKDIAYAKNRGIPWLVEEFGYDSGGDLSYSGGVWENPPGMPGQCIPLAPSEPGVTGSQNRACNVRGDIAVYRDGGAMGAMAWGFNPLGDYDRGIGGDEFRGFDAMFASDYEELKAAWRYSAMIIRGLSNYLYECGTDMLINSDPSTVTSITCEGPGNMTVNHTINNNVNINYRASEAIDFTVKNNGEGYDAPTGANVKAEVISTTACLNCNLIITDCTPPKLQNTESDQYQFTIQPNPFSLQTEIIFTLTEDTPVTIYITDMMGKNVATLVDNKMKTTGEHTITFDGRGYPAGMYMTHIQAGEYSGTQKMILAK